MQPSRDISRLLEIMAALRNPNGPCGSEFLLSGDVKGVILQCLHGQIVVSFIVRLGDNFVERMYQRTPFDGPNAVLSG